MVGSIAIGVVRPLVLLIGLFLVAIIVGALISLPRRGERGRPSGQRISVTIVIRLTVHTNGLHSGLTLRVAVLTALLLLKTRPCAYLRVGQLQASAETQ
ncbi:hypothetical protein GGI05_002918 [Coemansia sp. RSA 2603]|nr:hypothetical protein GGI05_002918 [Coemansia sp. RSA 2603]